MYSQRSTVSDVVANVVPLKPVRRKGHVKHPMRRLSLDQSMFEEKSSCLHHNQKPSRHWLMSELKRLKQENERLKQSSSTGEPPDSTEESRALELRLEESNNLKQKLEEEVLELRKVIENCIQSIGNYEKKNYELKQDVFILKNLVYRLNVQLETYQDKIRHLKNQNDLTTDDCHTVTEDSGVGDRDPKSIHQAAKSEVSQHTPCWKRSDIHAVAPLLEAYQESLDEKTELIQNYQKTLDTFSGRCKEIIAENEKLHSELAEAYKKGEVSFAEWDSLQREAIFTQEQNVLLMRQAKLHQNKMREIQETYQTNLAEITVDRDQLHEQWQTARSELLVLKGRFSVITDEHDKLKEEHGSRIPSNIHTAAVNEVKRLFEELKVRYEKERETLCRKLAALECDKPQLDLQVTSLTIERNQLQHKAKTLESQMTLYKAKCDQLQKHIKSVELSRIAAKRHLIRVMTFAREIIAEQEEFGAKATNQMENANLTAKVESLRHQLKDVEDGVSKELEFLDEKLRAKATGLNRLKHSHEKELQCFQAAVKQKDDKILELQKRSPDRILRSEVPSACKTTHSNIDMPATSVDVRTT